MLGLSQKEKDNKLWYALSQRASAEVKRALEKGANPNNAPSDRGGPLFDAVRSFSGDNMLNVVGMLLEHGAEVNRKASNGDTPLHSLLRGGYGDYYLPTVRRLLDAGADLGANYYEETPLWLALKAGSWQVAEALLASKPDQERPVIGGETVLMVAAAGVPLTLVDKLLEVPVDVNAGRGENPVLHRAVAGGQADFLNYLLSRAGTDADIADKDQKTPLLSAVLLGNAPIATALIKAGADANKPAAGGQTPLLAALGGKKEDLVEALLAAGARPDAPNEAGTLPLTAAVQVGSIRMTMALLAALSKGDAPAQGKADLQPALFAAAEKGSGRLLELLLAAGADVNGLDAEGRTPLMKAALSDQIEAMSILVKAGARPETADRSGMQAYDHAVSAGKKQSKDYLARYRTEAARITGGAGAAEAGDRYRLLNDKSLEVRESDSLTIIFNFWTQQVIFRDPAQGSPLTVQNFSEMQRQEAITEAYGKLRELGGNPPEPAAAALQKKALMPGKG